MTTFSPGADGSPPTVASLQRQLAVAQAEASLHLSEVRRLGFIVDKITEAAEGGVFSLHDAEANHMYVSEQLARILGYGDVGIPPSYKHFLEQVHPDDLRAALIRRGHADHPAAQPDSPDPAAPPPTTEASLATLEREVSDRARRRRIPNIFPTERGDHLEFRYLNQAGEYRWFRASAQRYRTSDDGPEHVIGLIIDIHAVKLLEEQRRQVNEELKAFMYSVAHDLRAPVRHIASFTEILREEPAAPVDERELYLNYVERSADKLGRMIDGLLRLSRNQRYVPKYCEVDVEAMLDQLISGTRQTERQAHELRIERDVIPPIYTDRMLLEQVLQNLLSNAIKYSSNRRRAVVRIRYYLQEAQHVISFSDNGVGFDPAYAGKLFQLFSRLYGEDDIPGTGVGLASVHRILRSLGGSIEADGKPGQGASFTVRLPVRVGATSAF